MIESKKQIFLNRVMDKSVMKHFIGRLVCWRGEIYTAHILDQLKTLGFENSTQTGFSLGIDDLEASPLKNWVVQDAENETNMSQEYCRHGCIHAIERLRQIVETWHTTSEFLKREMSISFNLLDPFNPVHMMSFSGARGNTSQVHQLVGMRGLISDPQGNIVDLPIQNNLREGLSLTEYIISCYGARKGVVDTAIRTADAGYLTRRLVQVAQHVVIRNIDCYTPWGIQLHSIRNLQGNPYLSNESRLVGRVLARPVYVNERCIATRNQDIGANLANRLTALYDRPILVRSPLGCKNTEWACQMCYGWGCRHGKMVTLGEAIGIVAGQSIGEPGTQLTLRTFHTGGVFTGDIANHIRAPFNGLVQFESDQCKPTRNRHGRIAWKCLANLSLVVKAERQTHLVIVPAHSLLFVSNNQYVEAKQILAEVRTDAAPFKERVQRHIYSSLQGEVVHKRAASLVSNSSLNAKTPSNPLCTGHVVVWSARMIQFQGHQVCTVYQTEDFIDTYACIGQQRASDDYTPPFLNQSSSQSLLIGLMLPYKKLNNTRLGVIRLLSVEESPINLRVLLLSVLDQFEIDRFNSLPLPEGIPHTQPNVFDNIDNTNHSVHAWLISRPRTPGFSTQWANSRCLLAIGSKRRGKPTLGAPIGLLGNILKVYIYKSRQTTELLYKTTGLFSKQTDPSPSPYNNSSTRHAVIWFWMDHYRKVLGDDHCNHSRWSHGQSNTRSLCDFDNKSSIPNLGQLVWKDTMIAKNRQLVESGKTICVSKSKIVLRLTQTYLLTSGAIIHANCYDTINKGGMLVTLMYEQLRTSDIIQGLPKAEQLLEARSINEVVLKLENNFFMLTEQILRRAPNLFDIYGLSTPKVNTHGQVELVNRIQSVYLAQGVRILDKHIEVVVRQMSSKVMLVEDYTEGYPSDKYMSEELMEFTRANRLTNTGNKYAFLPGELVSLARIKRLNCVLQSPVAYKPLLLGITRASLNTKSVISEASFQQTAKVLSRSALQGRTDWLKGLQENVIFGRLMPAGTGCKQIGSELGPSNRFLDKSVHRSKSKLFLNRSFPQAFTEAKSCVSPLLGVEMHTRVTKIALQSLGYPTRFTNKFNNDYVDNLVLNRASLSSYPSTRVNTPHTHNRFRS